MRNAVDRQLREHERSVQPGLALGDGDAPGEEQTAAVPFNGVAGAPRRRRR